MEMHHLSIKIPLTLRQRIIVEASTQALEKKDRVTETDVSREALIIGLRVMDERRKANVNPS